MTELKARLQERALRTLIRTMRQDEDPAAALAAARYLAERSLELPAEAEAPAAP